MEVLIIIIGLVVVIGLFLITAYNRLVRLRNNRENAFADIDVQLRQRHDLIPTLIETVKGYMKHEKELLTEVTNARARAMSAGSINEKIAAESQLSGALGGIQVAVEAYPDLKASQNFLNLRRRFLMLRINWPRSGGSLILPQKNLMFRLSLSHRISLPACLDLAGNQCLILATGEKRWKSPRK